MIELLPVAGVSLGCHGSVPRPGEQVQHRYDDDNNILYCAAWVALGHTAYIYTALASRVFWIQNDTFKIFT